MECTVAWVFNLQPSGCPVHVNRIIREAQKHGYLEVRKDKHLEVFPHFIELVENYASTYFSYVEHYLDIHPRES